jgi:predicted transcriptional regulator
MANFANTQRTQTLILDAIRQKNPDIRPGGTFDWLIVSSKLRYLVSTEEFVAAMTELGAAGMIGADETRRQFTLTEKGFEALSRDRGESNMAA